MNTVVMVTMLAGAIIGRAEFADMDTCLKQAEHVRTQSVAAQMSKQMAKNFPDHHGEWMDVACTYHVKEPDFSKYSKNLVEILDLLIMDQITAEEASNLIGADSEKMLKELEEYNRIQEMVNQQNLRN